MWEAVKGILSSKKALVSLVAMAVWFAGRFGLDLDASAMTGALAPLWVYVWAQGHADTGKEAAKIEAMTAKQVKPAARMTATRKKTKK